MNTYRIAVTYQMWGVYEVQADSLGEAERKALEENGLPTHASYIDDSMQLDPDYSQYGEVND